MEDELFLVVKGTLRMRFRDHEALVHEGEFIIVPHGVEHLPVADEEVHFILLEPKTTLNTGNITERKDCSPTRADLNKALVTCGRQRHTMDHRFYTLDVFTTTRFQGNPLAVITDGDGLSNDQMLAIAREMNLSETVFVQKPTDDRALARLRIFTTKEELKLAGHPVIGTWFLLAELGVVPAQEGGVHVLQQTGAGVLPVEIRFKDGRPQRVTMTQKEAAFKPSKINKKETGRCSGTFRQRIWTPSSNPNLSPRESTI